MLFKVPVNKVSREVAPAKIRILHLDALQIRSSKEEMGKVQAPQLPAQRPQQHQHVLRSVALSIDRPLAQLVQHLDELLLQRVGFGVGTAQALQNRRDEQPLIGLANVFPGSSQLQAMLNQANERPLFDLAGRILDKPGTRIFQHHRLQREGPREVPGSISERRRRASKASST